MIRNLTEVPEHILVKPATVRADRRWKSDYNVAAWFRFKEQNNESIKLCILWTDQSGDHQVEVDQSIINSSSILMSGMARLELHGQIKSMVVAVVTDHEHYTVDELFVQPSRTNAKIKLA